MPHSDERNGIGFLPCTGKDEAPKGAIRGGMHSTLKVPFQVHPLTQVIGLYETLLCAIRGKYHPRVPYQVQMRHPGVPCEGVCFGKSSTQISNHPHPKGAISDTDDTPSSAIGGVASGTGNRASSAVVVVQFTVVSGLQVKMSGTRCSIIAAYP